MSLSYDYLKRVNDRIAAQLGLDDDDKLDDAVVKSVARMPGKVTKPTKDDIRFPNVSMGQNCWCALNEWQLCVTKLGQKAPECFQRFRDFNTLCPTEWVASFKDHAEAGNYMGVAPVFEYDE